MHRFEFYFRTAIAIHLLPNGNLIAAKPFRDIKRQWF